MKLNLRNNIKSTKIKSYKLNLRRKSLKRTVQKFGWEGKGTKDNPYVMVPTDDSPLTLSLTTGAIYIKLKNLTLNKLNLYHCQNILIENCQIHVLNMECCKNIVVQNSSLLKVGHFLSGALTFENNDILKESYNRLSSNFYGKRGTILISFGLVLSIVFIRMCINWFITTTFTLFTSLIMFFGFIFLGAMLYFLKLKLKLRNLRTNEYLNFKYKTTDFFEDLYKNWVKTSVQ